MARVNPVEIVRQLASDEKTIGLAMGLNRIFAISTSSIVEWVGEKFYVQKDQWLGKQKKNVSEFAEALEDGICKLHSWSRREFRLLKSLLSVEEIIYSVRRLGRFRMEEMKEFETWVRSTNVKSIRSI